MDKPLVGHLRLIYCKCSFADLSAVKSSINAAQGRGEILSLSTSQSSFFIQNFSDGLSISVVRRLL